MNLIKFLREVDLFTEIISFIAGTIDVWCYHILAKFDREDTLWQIKRVKTKFHFRLNQLNENPSWAEQNWLNKLTRLESRLKDEECR